MSPFSECAISCVVLQQKKIYIYKVISSDVANTYNEYGKTRLKYAAKAGLAITAISYSNLVPSLPFLVTSFRCPQA